jgi:hypothetical protein
VPHTCYSSREEAEAENKEFKASLDYIVGTCSQNIKTSQE